MLHGGPVPSPSGTTASPLGLILFILTLIIPHGLNVINFTPILFAVWGLTISLSCQINMFSFVVGSFSCHFTLKLIFINSFHLKMAQKPHFSNSKEKRTKQHGQRRSNHHGKWIEQFSVAVYRQNHVT